MHSIFKNNTSPSLHLKKTFQNKGTNYAGEAHATTSDRVGPRYGLLIGSLTCSNRFVTWFSVFLLSLKTKTSKFQSQTQGHFSASSFKCSARFTILHNNCHYHDTRPFLKNSTQESKDPPTVRTSCISYLLDIQCFHKFFYSMHTLHLEICFLLASGEIAELTSVGVK